MNGLVLLKTLIEATGLPPTAVERELNKIIFKNGLEPEKLSLDDIRNILSTYLLETMTDAKRILGASTTSFEAGKAVEPTFPKI